MKRPGITPAMRYQVFRDHGAIALCQVCGDSQRIADMALDHHLALIDGGEHDASNLRPICSSCHAKKSAGEHKNNAKAKRLALARELHHAIVVLGETRKTGTIKSRGFKGWRKFNGQQVRREKQS